MKNKSKEIIKTILFLIILGFIINVLSYILIKKDIRGENRSTTTIVNFYEEPKNTLDVLFFGTSFVAHGISPLTIWDDFGIPSYSLANEQQLPILSNYLLRGALKYQNPKVVVLGSSYFFQKNNYDKKEATLKQSFHFTPFSLLKLKTILEIVKNSDNQRIIDYLSPLEAHHGRWEELQPYDFGPVTDKYAPKGADVSYTLGELNFAENYMEPNQSGEIDHSETNKKHLIEFINMCKNNDIDLVIISTPNKKWNYNKSAAMKLIADQYEIPFIDYNEAQFFNEINIDTSMDSFDNGHLNIYGAEKISLHIGQYLVENYDLRNKKNDDAYKEWNEVLDHLKKEMIANKKH